MPQVKITLSVDFPHSFFLDDLEDTSNLIEDIENALDRHDGYLDEHEIEIQ